MAPPPLHVYDGVLAASTSRYLHTALSLGELGDEHHTVLDRRAGPPKTALEHCLNSVLKQLRDESPFVEYWWRDSWEHVEAHEDVDEFRFEQTGERRYPTNAHVLYLTTGSAVRGPTCVWARAEEQTGHSRRDFGALAVCPASRGRLLRFDGELMHAVPRPTLRWLPPATRSQALSRQGAASREDAIRSVVLFNTWEERPDDVGSADGAADPEAVIRSIAASFSSPKIDALVEVMQEPDYDAQPFEDWQLVEPVHKGNGHRADRAEEPEIIKIALLGGEARRGQAERAHEMAAPEGLADSLLEESTVTYFS